MGISQTIENLIGSPEMETITDRSQPVNGLVDEVKAEWAYDMLERKPAPAYVENGLTHASDIDLVSVLSALDDRNAIINIPEYDRRRAKTTREDEWVVSDKNRHGKLIGLVSNKDVFSFSVRIYDQNVVNTDTNETGAYRNFLVTDLEGQMYKGWSTIEFRGTEEEKDFFDKSGIALGNSIPVKNFVTPQLWSSFFSGKYVKLKSLIARLEDEAGYYRTATKQLKDALHIQSEKGYVSPIVHKKGPKTTRGKSIPIVVEGLKAEMDVPLTGEYTPVPFNKAGYEMAKDRANTLTYSTIPRLRFNARAVELAFLNGGEDGEKNPGWNHPEIERGVKLTPRARTEWNKMDFGEGYSIRFRTFEKTERVDPGSENSLYALLMSAK